MGFDGEEVSRLHRVKRKSRKELSLKRFAGLVVLLALQLVLGTNAAYAALSASCTAVNALSGSAYSASYAAGSFNSDESVSVSYSDNGNDPASINALATDHVLLQDAAQTNAYGYNYYSSSHVSGSHSYQVTSSQLSATGLNLVVNVGTYITGLTVTCSGSSVSAPTVAATSTTVAANSSNNTVTLSITGTATSVAVASAPSHGTATATGTSITYTPVAGYSGADSFTYTATNSGGTSTAATANITVTATAVALSPTAGALASATVNAAYSQTFSASGGTGPYTYALSGTLPTGLTLNTTTGLLSGTPTTSGSYSFTVTVTDAASATASNAYTLTVAAAGSTSAPVAVNQTATVMAGQTITVNLTNGATGSPYTGATLLNTPSASQGTATITNTYYLTFAAAAQASGTLALQYSLTNATGTSNTATVTVQITKRSDPSKDQQVTGLVNAQAQSAVQFASAQLSNFNNRLEHLHKESERRSGLFNITVAVPRDTRNQDGLASSTAANDASGLATGEDPAKTKAGGQSWVTDPNLALWTGGYVNFGTTNKDSLRFDHTTVGISAGADYRFGPDFVAGLGLGFGRDVSDIASSGTQSKGNAASAALYASYHPGQLFVDTLLGYSYLNFNSHRYITDSGGSANGSRNGQQFFGALSSGYEFQWQNLMLSPYGRLQFSTTLLRHYTETGGGDYNLSYANQRINTLALVGGLRSQYGIPTSWGALRLTGRLEYSQSLKGDSVATMGYADVGNDTYAVTVLGLDQNTISASAGIEFLLRRGWTLALTYQGSTSMDSSTRENTLIVRGVYKY